MLIRQLDGFDPHKIGKLRANSNSNSKLELDVVGNSSKSSDAAAGNSLYQPLLIPFKTTFKDAQRALSGLTAFIFSNKNTDSIEMHSFSTPYSIGLRKLHFDHVDSFFADDATQHRRIERILFHLRLGTFSCIW